MCDSAHCASSWVNVNFWDPIEEPYVILLFIPLVWKPTKQTLIWTTMGLREFEIKLCLGCGLQYLLSSPFGGWGLELGTLMVSVPGAHGCRGAGSKN